MIDWRVRDGRLECLMGLPHKPMRTVHLLVGAAGEQAGSLRMSVHTGPVGGRGENTWTGFLIGVGGEHVDFRISALCHQWPAADGGMIAALDGTGKLVLRNNSQRDGRVPRKLGAWPLIAVSDPIANLNKLETVALRLTAKPVGEGYALTLSAHEPATGRRLAQVVAKGVAPQQVSGNVALVSHGSPERDGKGYWFEDWRVEGTKFELHPERAFGPVVAAQHTLSRGVLKITAQMPPLGKDDSQTARLQIRRDDHWYTVAEGRLIEHSYTILFRVENWDSKRSVPYRIAYDLRTVPDSTKTYYYEGTIRAEPKEKDSFVVAAFTGHHISAKGEGDWNHNSVWYPHNELVAAVEVHRPDLLFFSGDQIYEGGLAGIIREPAELACIDYLYKWYRWCWAFGDLARDVPTICIPDDHDVYHGNLWGAGGKKADGVGKKGQDSGGYVMAPLFVNAVQRTQTSHLPDPFDPEPVLQDIGVYYTRMEYAGLSFAVIEDRKWKSSPTVAVPAGQCVNGWFQNPDFDPVTEADVPGARLLGERQLAFLNDWANDWSGGAWMKVVLSQTIFANVATLPKSAGDDSVVPKMKYAKPGEYIEGDQLAADADSNGWPQTGRNKALRAMRKGFAFHIAGDQHLGSFIHYGVDDWDDAGFALCVPSIGNVWPRRWFPPTPGRNRPSDAPAYTGEHLDGFGNPITVHAVSNPVESGCEPRALYDRVPGYGIVRFNRKARDICVEVWPRWVDPSQPGAKCYYGWPVTVSQCDNYGRKAAAFLPEIEVTGRADPVVQVLDEANGEIVYTVRINGSTFKPKVFKPGVYTLKVDGKVFKGVKSVEADSSETLRVTFR